MHTTNTASCASLCVVDVDGCTLDTDGCGGDSAATCSLGNGVNSRTCTCDVGYSGTTAAIADADAFGGCTGSMCVTY
jgi:hypothetical protein